MHTNRIIIYLDPLILLFTPFVYFAVTLSNQFVKLDKTICSSPFAFCFYLVGFNNKVQSAGVNDKAMNADIITDMAMVMANCWYNLPTMPGIKPTGTNTAASISAMATTGAEISFIAW